MKSLELLSCGVEPSGGRFLRQELTMNVDFQAHEDAL